MNSCIFPTSLTVNKGTCPDWTQLAWNAPTVSPPANGSLIFSFGGANVSCQENNDNGLNNGFSISAVVGSLVYTGPGCACKVIISGSITGTYDPNLTNAGFNVTQDNVVKATYQFQQGSNAQTLLFNLAAGMNSVIRVADQVGFFYSGFFRSLNQQGANVTNLSLQFANQ